MKTLKAMAVAVLGMVLAGAVWADPAKKTIALSVPAGWWEMCSDQSPEPWCREAFDDYRKSMARYKRLMQSCIDQSPEPAFAETWCREAFYNWR